MIDNEDERMAELYALKELVFNSRIIMKSVRMQLQEYEKEREEFIKKMESPEHLNFMETSHIRSFLRSTTEISRYFGPLMDQMTKIIEMIDPQEKRRER